MMQARADSAPCTISPQLLDRPAYRVYFNLSDHPVELM